MIELRGHFFDGKTSRQWDATLHIYVDGTAELRHDAGGGQRSLFGDLSIGPRLANTPRRISFPDGGVFETTANEAVDRAVAQHGGGGAGRFIHALESRWRYLALAIALVLTASVAFVVWGVPSLARLAAFALPATTSTAIGRGALDALDDTHLEKSELPEERREVVRRIFARVAEERKDDEIPLALVFRGGGRLGANALALPSGAIVVTDELLALTRADEEIEAVLAHEVGHVVHRHSLRHVIQSSLIAAAIILATGDLSSTSSLVVAVPTILAETSFSRDFEREADRYAAAYLRAGAIDPIHFANLLRSLEAAAEAEGGAALPGFLATHPATEERIRALERGPRG